MKNLIHHFQKAPAAARLVWVFAILFSLNASQSWGQTTLFNDNFNTSTGSLYDNSGAIGTSTDWSLARSGSDWGARITGNILDFSNTATGSGASNGWIFGYRDINALSGWNTTLSSNTGPITWEFNMRQIRTDPAGFSSGNYGVAFVLAGTSTTAATSGAGYAVVLGQSGPTDPIRLAHFNNGLGGTLTNIIASNTSGLTDFGTNYLSVRVTYIPSSNTWELFLRNDGTTAFVDPATGTLVSQGTAVNNTYTSTAGMRYIGGYWQGSTALNQTAFFDNVYLKKTSAELTPCNYSQNFNSMGTAGTAPPAGWNHFGVLGGDNGSWPSSSIIPASGSPSAASSGTLNNTLLVSTGSGVSSNTQAYNFGASGNSDRALGTSPTSDAGNILELTLTNATGASVSSFNLSYDVRRFTAPSTANQLPGYWIFVSSNNGSTWTEVSDLRPNSTTVPNTVGVSNFGPTLVTLPAAVANGSPIKIRWVDDNANETSPDQIIGLDNVVLSYGLTAATLSSALTTTFGTASTGVSFIATGSNVNGNITVTPQSNYEVSTTSASAGFGTAAINVANNTTVWLRLRATAPAGTYNNVTAAVLSGGGSCSNVNVNTSASGNTVNSTVTFNANGGTGTMANQTASAATNLTANAFTRTGYTFAGWNTASNGSGTSYANGASFPFTANTTLFAQWTANTLTITYNSQGGSAISNGSTTTGGSIAASPGTPTRAGYTFNGWFTASSGGTAISFPYTHNQTANFTLFAQWTANTLTVTFDSQGGSAISNGSTTTGGTVADPGNPTRASFTFDGWFVAASGGTAITFPYTHNQTANFTLFAQWTVAGSPTLNGATLGTALSNIYGTASTGVSFTASGTFLSGNITVTAQTGYEVSTSSGSGYGASVSVASGTTVWVRFAALQNAGTYNNAAAAVLSSAGATPVNVLTSGSGNTVSPKPLSVTAPSIASKAYDGTTTAGAVTVGTLSDFVGTQTVTATGAAANYSSANAGSYAGVVITYTLSNGTNGGLAANYSLANGSASGVITPKALTITAPSIASKVYDATTTAGAVTAGTLSGLVGSETLTVTGAAANYSSANAGTYAGVVITYTLINGSGLAANYSLANGTATGVITPKALSITAPTIASKVYDATSTAGAVTVGTLSGLVGSETLTVTGAAANYSSANAGTYAGVVIAYTLINGSGLAANYSLANGSATGVITPKALGITAPTIASKVYDASTTAGAVTAGTLSGLVGSEALTVTGAAANYSSANVGTYAGVVITYTLINGTGLAANYSLAAGSATGVITQRTLTVTATDATKEIAQVITGGAGSSAFTSSGLQGGQTIGSVTITYGAAAGSTGQGATAGTYAGQATPSAATGGTFNAANYAITYVAGAIIVTSPNAMVLSTFGSAVCENFSGLATSGTSSTMPTGWTFSETGTNANATYTAGTGSSNTGDTYSFGTAGDRTLGGLLSGSLNPTFGARVFNNTGSTISTLSIAYTGKTWRVGTANRSDRIDFQYSTNATSLTTGTWTDENNLDYANPGQAAAANGSVQHSANITFTMQGLSLAPGASIWIRWTDFDASGADDGMGVDDVCITPTCTAPATQSTGITFSSVGTNSLTLNWTNGNADGRVILAKAGSAVDANPTIGSNPTANLAFGSGTQLGTGNFTVFNGTGSGPITISGLNPNTTYHFHVYEYCSPGRTYNTNTATNNPSSTTTIALPTLTTTALSSITTTTATSGGNISNDGGSAVTARGIVWGTSTNPTIPSANSTTDGSGPGSFSSSLIGLSPETTYHVRAYASNGAGTAYGNNQTFYTLSNQPTLQATNLIATPQSSSQINLAWDAAEFALSGATQNAYVLLRATSPQVPTLSSVNGQAPVAGIGTVVSANIVNPTSTFNNTGLASSTTYNYLLVPYSWDGVNAGTIHYLSTNAPTATATTQTSSCAQPTVQSTNASASSIGQSGFTINWTAGNGDRSLVVVRANAPVSAIPVDGTAYTGNAVFGNGTALASGEFAVYANNGSSVTISGLAASTTYYVSIFAYNTTGSCYLVSSSATANATTLPSVSIVETFEPGTKVSYTAANVTCNLGVWNFTDALIGTTAGSDRFNGTRSSRLINSGSITMQFDKTGGIGTVTVNHAAYGGDGSSTWQLEASTNGGASFDAFVSSVYSTSGTTLVPTVITLNIPGDVRIRIRKLSGGGNRINIDDIAFTSFSPSNTISTGTISGSPFCISNTADGSVTVPFTATGTFNEENVFIAQLSNATGNFSTPIEIGTLNSSTAGSINALIPAGTLNGTGYRIRVISTSPEVTGAVNASNLAVYLNAPDASNFYVNVINGSSVSLNWTNPAACFDELLVVAKQGSATTAAPSGNGSAYTANAAFASAGSNASLPANEFAVYKNSVGTSVTITGLTANTVYFFELFTRKGTLWSDGIIVSTIPFNPQAGDFQTTGSGNYSSASTWQRYDGSSWQTAAQYPNQAGTTPGTATVTIRTGHTVVLDASRSGNPINNLIVQSGGRIWAQDSTYNGNRYLTIYGNITCNGTIGRGANLYDNISFNIEGNPSTISGAGSFNASRIRKNFTTNSNSEVIISMNVGLKFASGVGSSSGTCLYNNVSGPARFNLTVNENSSLSLYTSVGSSGNLSIDGIDGEGSGERSGTFNINGTLTIPGTLFAYTDNTTQAISYVIGTSGVVNCVNVCTANSASASVASGSAAAGCTLRILNGGRLNLTGGNASDANTYNKPFSVRSNTASPFTFNAGLGLTNNTFDFQAGSVVEYSSTTGTMPVQSQNLTYSNLKISGAATKTINSTLNVSKNLTIASPAVFSPSANTINLGGDWNNYSATGFTEGTSLVVLNGTAEQNIYCPGGETFNSLTISNPSTDGVILRTDVNVSSNLNMGSNGRLFFGSAPSVLSLTNMANGSTALSGSGTSLIDMSGAPHIFNIGAQTPGFTGQFNAGNESIVNYYRSGGSQNIITGLTYHNLNFTGSDSKILSGSIQVNGDWNIDGASVALSADQLNSTATIAGNLTLSAGASMNSNCLDNLSIVTTAQNGQIMNGNGNTLRCFNFTSHKSGTNGLALATNTALNIKNDLNWKHIGTGGIFSDGGNTISLGDDLIITGVQDRFNFSGTMILTGENDPTNTLGNETNGMIEARLNNLTIQGSGTVGNSQLMPLAGGQNLHVDGNLLIQNGNALLPGILNPNGNTINLAGNWTSYNAAGFVEGTSTLRFTGASLQDINTVGGEVFYNANTDKTGGSVSLSAPLQVNNNFTLTAGSFDVSANNYALIVGGNWTNNATFSPRSGSVTFNGSGDQTISTGGTGAGKVFYNVIKSGSGTATLAGAMQVGNNFTLSTGTFDVSPGSFALNVGGNWTNSAAFVPRSGTVTFNGTGDQTIASGGTGTGKVFHSVNTDKPSGTASLSAAMQVSNNFTLSTGTFDVSAGNFNLNVGGNWTNNATFTPRNGTVTCNGTAVQILSGANTFQNLTVSNAAGVSLNNNITINGTVDIQTGSLQTLTNKVTLGSSAEITETQTAQILGEVETTRTLGLSIETFGGIGVEIDADGEAPGVTVVKRFTGTPVSSGVGEGISVKYSIVPANNDNLDATLVFRYKDSDLNEQDKNNFQLYRSVDGGIEWTEELAIGDPDNNMLTKTNISSFSEWTAADVNIPLPVNLLSFSGKAGNMVADLNWTTASEQDNAGFRVYKSADGQKYELLSFVSGAVNSLDQRNYRLRDGRFTQSSYYKLTMVDGSGKESAGKVLFLDCQCANRLQIKVSPNPGSGDVHFSSNQLVTEQEVFQLELQGMDGKMLYQNHTGLNRLEELLNERLRSLPAGIYHLRLFNARVQEKVKLQRD